MEGSTLNVKECLESEEQPNSRQQEYKKTVNSKVLIIVSPNLLIYKTLVPIQVLCLKHITSVYFQRLCTREAIFFRIASSGSGPSAASILAAALAGFEVPGITQVTEG